MRTPAHQRPTRASFFGSITAAAWVPGVAALVAVLYGVTVGAYPQYTANRDATNCNICHATNCHACHGDFRANPPYYSKHDGVTWKNPSSGSIVSLHDGHINMVSGNCSVCHSSATFPVILSQSSGGAGFPAIGCLGCHGRAETAAGGAVTGAGLRQHHYRSGVTVCGTVGCHTDADPATFTTVDEHTFPPYYFMPDGAHPNKPANACNIGGSEGAVAPPSGLDNDGDLIYDGAEPECAPTPTRLSTWGSLKVRYR